MTAPARSGEAKGQYKQNVSATVTEGYSAVSFVPTDMPQTAVSVYKDMIVIDTIMPPTRYLPPTLSMTKLAAQMQTDLLAELERLGLGHGSQVGSIAHPRSDAAEAEPPRGYHKSGQQISLKLRPQDKRRAQLGIRSLRGEPYLSFFPSPQAGEPVVVNGATTSCPCVCCRSGCSGADPSTGRLPVIESALVPEPKEQVSKKVQVSAEDKAPPVPPAMYKPTELLSKTTDDLATLSVSGATPTTTKRVPADGRGPTRITVLPRSGSHALKAQRSAPNLHEAKAVPGTPSLRSLIAEEARQSQKMQDYIHPRQQYPVTNFPVSSSVPPVPPVPSALPMPKTTSAPHVAVHPEVPYSRTYAAPSTKFPVHDGAAAIQMASAARGRSQAQLSSSPPDTIIPRRPATHSTVTLRSTPKTPPPRRISPPRRFEFSDNLAPNSAGGHSQASVRTIPTPGLSMSSHSAHSSPGSRCEAMYGNSPPPFMHYDNRNEPHVRTGHRFAPHTSASLLDAARGEVLPPMPEDAAATVAQYKAQALGLKPPLQSVGSRIRVVSGNSPLLRSPAL